MVGGLKRRLGELHLRLTGWRLDGDKPALRKYVLIGAPHTSNWDLVYTLALGFVSEVRIAWLGKHTLFRGPLGWLFRRLGGIPVDRSAPHGMVAEIARHFAVEDALVLVVAPEATRRRVEYWKSGFYQIAREACVPIVLGFLDYPHRRGGYGPAITPTDDVSADMDAIRAFYRDKVGRRPHCQGPIRLRKEERNNS